MANVDVRADRAIADGTTQDAGFWKRALALVIDCCVVSTAVSLLLLLLAALIPSLGRMATLATPFGIGTVERTVESKSTETTAADGTKFTDTEKIIERSVLDRWIYRFRVEETTSESEGDRYIT